MKEFTHYTEEDLQGYFDRNFAGDITALENHLQECELCSKNFEAYSMVWSFAKNDLKIEPLRINLANTVANKVFAAKESYPVFEKVMYGIFICLGIVCLYLCFNYLFSHSIPTPFILLTIPFCLYLLLTYKEIRIVNKKFALY
jgi:hypothetical protein